jgi:FkbM family methyltransferase
MMTFFYNTVQRLFRLLGLQIRRYSSNLDIREKIDSILNRHVSCDIQVLIRAALKNPSSGTVVIIGAHDHVSFDSIADLLKDCDKRKILYEPRKVQYDRLLRNIADYGITNSEPYMLAIHPSLGTVNLFSVRAESLPNYPAWASGIASFSKQHVLQHVKENEIDCIHVKCTSPDNWARDFQISKIAYLQIDAEGFDFEILKATNLVYYKPSVLKYEFVNLTIDDQLQSLLYLRSFGYDLFIDREDIVAANLAELLDSVC